MLKTIAAVSFATAGGLWFIRKLLDSQEEAQPTCRAILREIDLSDFVGETRHPPNSVRATNVYPRGCYVSAPKRFDRVAYPYSIDLFLLFVFCT